MRIALCILIAICAINASANNHVIDVDKSHRPFLRRSHSINIPNTNKTISSPNTAFTITSPNSAIFEE